MKTIHFAASVVMILGLSVSGGAEEQPFAYEICLDKSPIELGTRAALSLVITNTAPEEIVVMAAGPVFDLPRRYEKPTKGIRVISHEQHTPHTWSVAPGESLFLVGAVPRDEAFTPLMLGRHTGTAAFEVRWGRGLSELMGVFPMFDDPRPEPARSGRAVFRIPVSYEIVPPSEEWMPLRQKYTREVVVKDLFQGGQEVVAYQLDGAGLFMELKAEVEAQLRREWPEAYGSVSVKELGKRYAREEAMLYSHPNYRLAMQFKAYVANYPKSGDNLDWAFEGLKDLLEGRVLHADQLDRFLARIDADPAPSLRLLIHRAVLLMTKSGFHTGLSFLRSLDVSRFDCADRALYREVLAYTEKKAREPEKLPRRVLTGVGGQP